MSTCSCSLAGTKACDTCPNGPAKSNLTTSIMGEPQYRYYQVCTCGPCPIHGDVLAAKDKENAALKAELAKAKCCGNCAEEYYENSDSPPECRLRERGERCECYSGWKAKWLKDAEGK